MAVKQDDLVLITWTRNPLVPGSARRIVAVRIIGSAKPCKTQLVPNGLLINALNCLFDPDIGFKVVYSKKTTNISGYLLLQGSR